MRKVPYGHDWMPIRQPADVIGRNPYVGVGLDDKSSRVDVLGLELLSDGTTIFNRHQVHNLLLGSWYGAGLLGLLGIIAILMATLQVGILLVLRAANQDERLLAASLLASFAGFVVFAQGTVVLYQRYGWIGSALLLAVWVQQTRRRRSPQAISPNRLPRPLQANAFSRDAARSHFRFSFPKLGGSASLARICNSTWPAAFGLYMMRLIDRVPREQSPAPQPITAPAVPIRPDRRHFPAVVDLYEAQFCARIDQTFVSLGSVLGE